MAKLCCIQYGYDKTESCIILENSENNGDFAVQRDHYFWVAVTFRWLGNTSNLAAVLYKDDVLHNMIIMVQLIKGLCHHLKCFFRKPKDILISVETQNNCPVLNVSALILNRSVFGCEWPWWKWIATWKNCPSVLKFIACCLGNSLKLP